METLLPLLFPDGPQLPLPSPQGQEIPELASGQPLSQASVDAQNP